MGTNDALITRAEAAADFERVRRQAALKELFGWLRGESVKLLSYDDVRARLHARETGRRTLEDIPIDAIVGSAGRYHEFTRGFLPGKHVSRSRWGRVKLAMTGMRGVPPIEVYRVGRAYFVQDGNHRVSVAREMGFDTIQAYVTEVLSDVAVGPELDAKALIIATEEADFLQQTGARSLLPEVDLRLTATGQYPVLLEHINVHRYYMGEAAGHEVSLAEALQHWYAEVYAPVVELIRERDLLCDFPERTEADLYLWLTLHRDELADELGWDVDLDAATSSLGVPLADTRRPARDRLEQVLDASTDPATRDSQREPIVRDLLVVTDGGAGGSRAIGLGLAIATREDARLYGLAIEEGELDDAGRRTVRDEFEQRCALASRSGQLVFASGNATDAIIERSRLADLVVAPYAQQRTGSLSPAFRAVLRRCPRPVLCVPAPRPGEAVPTQPIERILLAYDASPKAGEALQIAAYLAGWWEMQLTVLTVAELARSARSIESRARKTLESLDVNADYLRRRGKVANAVLKAARESQADMLLMGGYGHGAALNLVLGSATIDVLERTDLPVLVCQ